MAMLAGASKADHVVEVPERVRLADENPLTLRPYSRARWHDLPPYVAEAIEVNFGVTAAQWDRLVRCGQVAEVLDCREPISLRSFLASVRARGDRQPPRSVTGGPGGVCPDCWGTLAVADVDASVTGRRDGVYLCSCAAPVISSEVA